MNSKHPVSLLQELMARQRKEAPLYEITDISTKGSPRFRCTVKADGVIGTAEYSTKQTAKKEAAARVLRLLASTNINKTNAATRNDDKLVLTTTLNYNAVGALNEYASQSRMSYPTYCEGGLTATNEFVTTCKLHDIVTEGYGSTKKIAKQFAAHHMLKLCKETNFKNRNSQTPSVTKANTPSDEEIFAKYKELKQGAVSPKIEAEDNSGSNSPVHSSLRNPLFEDSSPSKQIEEPSFDELCEQLKRLTVAYTVEIIGRKPFVLLLRFRNEETTIVETGNTYEEAQCKLFKKALLVINVMKDKA